MIKVIVFSDIRIYCEGLTQVLSSIESIDVVGAESHFQDAIDKIQLVKPDVVLLDMTMEGSCRIAQKIMQQFPNARIVALAAPEDKDKVIRCAELGVAGYVAREASLNELIETLKCATKGEFCYPPRIAAYIFRQIRRLSIRDEQHCLKGGASNNAGLEINDGLDTVLTCREKQIAEKMAEGESNKQIARSLSIEVSTVKNHVHNILVKLDVKNRAQVASLLHHTEREQGFRSIDLEPHRHLSN